MLKILFRSAVRHSAQPEGILAEMNEGFCDVTLEEDFATAAVISVDQTQRLLRYASAGHETGYLMKASGDTHELRSTGMLIGIDPAAPWDTRDFPVAEGDRVVFLTDGLPEAMSADGQLLGKCRLRHILEAQRQLPVDRFTEAVIEQVRLFSAGGRHHDDMTILSVDF